jgi:hypothetical protein
MCCRLWGVWKMNMLFPNWRSNVIMRQYRINAACTSRFSRLIGLSSGNGAAS